MMQQKWIHEHSDSLLVLGDFNCNYNIFPYEVDPEVEIVIKGQFPYARYMSLTVNGEVDVAIASAPDQAILPDPGSMNPTLPGTNWEAKNRNFTLIIRFIPPPPGSAHFVPAPGNNTIYAGTLPNGRPNTGGIIALRIYVPSIGYDDTGGVGLPKITYRSAKNKKNLLNLPKANQPTTTSTKKVAYKSLEEGGSTTSTENNFSANRCDLTWAQTNKLQAELLQANPNSIYILSSEINRDPGKLLYIRWKAPTVPDTFHNIGVIGNEDMRYWSLMFATNIGLLGLYTLGDVQSVIDKNGYVNVVIGFGAQRPPYVTPENGFTWVELSHLPLVHFSIIYRNTLISPTFPYTAKDVPNGVTVPPEVMGEYYPCGKYVDPFYFSQ